MTPVTGTNFALGSYEKFHPGFRDEKRPGRVLARISRNKATMAKHKGITFGHIIALETVNSVSLQLNEMLMMSKIQQAKQDGVCIRATELIPPS